MLPNDKIIIQYIEIIKAVAEAWNGQDIERLLSYLDDDIYWDDPAMEEPARGHDMLKDFALSFWGAFPDVRYIPLQDIFLSPEQTKMAHRFTMTGTMLGQLPPGFAPTGRRFEIDGLEMIEFREEKVYRIITRIDGIKVAEQLGLLPPRLKAGSRKVKIVVFFQRLIAWYLRRSARTV
ncbi:MAG: ester cyclase [Desulfobacteraceae bacterium]|nr:ester cyclase [Desulfobacteraceae bacterium]